MSNLLYQWLNNEIQLDIFVSDESSFCNGYLIAEILYKYNQISNFREFKNSQRVDDIIKNYCLLDNIFTELNIDFSTRDAIDMINNKKGVASKLLYKLQMRLRNAQMSTIPVGTAKSDQVVKLPVFKENVPKKTYTDAKHRIFEQALRMTLENQNTILMRKHLMKFNDTADMNRRTGTSRRIRERKEDETKNESFRQTQLDIMHRNRKMKEDKAKYDNEQWLINMSIREAENNMKKAFKETQLNKTRTKQWMTMQQDMAVVDELEIMEQTLNLPRKPDPLDLTSEEIEKRAEETKEDFDDRINKTIGHKSEWLKNGRKTYEEITKNREFNRDKSIANSKRRQRFLCLLIENDDNECKKRINNQLCDYVCRESNYEKDINVKNNEIIEYIKVADDNRLYRQNQLDTKTEERKLEIETIDNIYYDNLSANVESERDKQSIIYNDIKESNSKEYTTRDEDEMRELLNEIILFSFNVIDYIEVRHNKAPDHIIRDNSRIFSANMKKSGNNNGETSEGEDDGGAEDRILNYRELYDYIKGEYEWKFSEEDEFNPETEVTIDDQNYTNFPEGIKPLTREGYPIEYVAGEVLYQIEKPLLPPAEVEVKPEIPVFPMQLIVIGKPFAGKSTVIKELCKKYNLKPILLSEIIPMIVNCEKKSLYHKYKKQIKEILRKGRNVTGSLLVDVLITTIKNIPKEKNGEGEEATEYKGYVIEGYPQTLEQAQLFELKLSGYKEKKAEEPLYPRLYPIPDRYIPQITIDGESKIDGIIDLLYDNDNIIKRVEGRVTSNKNKENYHIYNNPPPSELLLSENLEPTKDDKNYNSTVSCYLYSYNRFHDEMVKYFDRFGYYYGVDLNDKAEEEVINEVENIIARVEESQNNKAMKREEELTREYLHQLQLEKEKEMEREDLERKTMYEEDIWIQLKFLNGEDEEVQDLVYKPMNKSLSDRLVERGFPVMDLNESYLNRWKLIEKNYVNCLLELFDKVRSTHYKCVNHYDSVRMAYIDFIKRVHNKQELVNESILKFNEVPIDLRININTKYELHQLITDLNNKLWEITENRDKENVKELFRIRNDDWIYDELVIIIECISYTMQMEIDKLYTTIRILDDYQTLNEGKSLKVLNKELVEREWEGPIVNPYYLEWSEEGECDNDLSTIYGYLLEDDGDVKGGAKKGAKKDNKKNDKKKKEKTKSSANAKNKDNRKSMAKGKKGKKGKEVEEEEVLEDKDYITPLKNVLDIGLNRGLVSIEVLNKRFSYIPKPDEEGVGDGKKGGKKKSIKGAKGKASTVKKSTVKKSSIKKGKDAGKEAEAEVEKPEITEMVDEIRKCIEYECNECARRYKRLYRIGLQLIEEFTNISKDAYEYMNEEEGKEIKLEFGSIERITREMRECVENETPIECLLMIEKSDYVVNKTLKFDETKLFQ